MSLSELLILKGHCHSDFAVSLNIQVNTSFLIHKMLLQHPEETMKWFLKGITNNSYFFNNFPKSRGKKWHIFSSCNLFHCSSRVINDVYRTSPFFLGLHWSNFFWLIIVILKYVTLPQKHQLLWSSHLWQICCSVINLVTIL